MQIIFDATSRPVKTTRRNFGLGLTRVSSRRERFQPSPEDQAFWAANSPRRHFNYETVYSEEDAINAHFDRLAREAEAQARIDMGLLS